MSSPIHLVHAYIWLLSFYRNGIFANRLPYEFAENIEHEYRLPDLPYEYKELEPFIDEATVRVHHTGHHAAYTTKMNKALKQWRNKSPDDDLLKKNLLEILTNIEDVPEEFFTQIRNNAGGYVNHNFYWSVMSPNQNMVERSPTESVLRDLQQDFGNFSNFKSLFDNQAITLFGSGYVWLSRQPEDERLVVSTTANQDSPLSQGLHPILVLDVWEHAYYLKHQNKRNNHISDWWKLVNWNAVEEIDKWWKLSYAQSIHDEF